MRLSSDEEKKATRGEQKLQLEKIIQKVLVKLRLKKILKKGQTVQTKQDMQKLKIILPAIRGKMGEHIGTTGCQRGKKIF